MAQCLGLAEQVWQLGDIRRNPPRLVLRQQLGRRACITQNLDRQMLQVMRLKSALSAQIESGLLDR